MRCVRPLAVAVFALATLAPAAVAQTGVSGSSAVLFDRYSFEGRVDLPGFGSLGTVSQISLPISVKVDVSPAAQLVITGGYQRVEASVSGGPSLVVGGVTDVETRLSYTLVPDRISLFATASLPTGTASLESEAVPLLGVLVADVLSFTTERLGSGGSGGIGVAGTVPAGQLAFAWAASYTRFGGFDPIVDGGSELTPGGELRLRAGFEGAVGPRSYLRIAGIYSRKGDDQVGDDQSSRTGNRATGYVSFDQAVGRGRITAYVLDAFRGSPTIEGTPFGPAALPRGNLIAGGLVAYVPLAPATTLIPRIELRRSDQALDPASSDMIKLGTSTRVGGDVRHSLSNRATVVFEADALFGNVSQALFAPTGTAVSASVTGLRAGAHLSLSW